MEEPCEHELQLVFLDLLWIHSPNGHTPLVMAEDSDSNECWDGDNEYDDDYIDDEESDDEDSEDDGDYESSAGNSGERSEREAIPIIQTAARGDVDAVRAMLFGDGSASNASTLPLETDAEGRSALSHAAKPGSVACVAELICKNAEVNARQPQANTADVCHECCGRDRAA